MKCCQEWILFESTVRLFNIYNFAKEYRGTYENTLETLLQYRILS